MRIDFFGASAGESVKKYIKKKVNKLEKYFSKIESAKVELNEYSSRKDGKNFRVEITVDIARKFVRGEEYGHSFEEACDLAVEKAEKQLRRYKSRIQDRYRKPAEAGTIKLEPVKDESPIARVKRFQVKPMSTDEAIMQMDLTGHDFYIYEEQGSGEFHVLYRRSDGTLGLLVPET